MRNLVTPPLGTAAAAHALSWVVAVFFVYEVAVVAGEPDNTIALIAICTPVLMSGLTLFCASRLCCRATAWVVAWIVLGICLIGIASIGLFMMPVAGLMFWSANEIPEDIFS